MKNEEYEFDEIGWMEEDQRRGMCTTVEGEACLPNLLITTEQNISEAYEEHEAIRIYRESKFARNIKEMRRYFRVQGIETDEDAKANLRDCFVEFLFDVMEHSLENSLELSILRNRVNELLSQFHLDGEDIKHMKDDQYHLSTRSTSNSPAFCFWSLFTYVEKILENFDKDGVPLILIDDIKRKESKDLMTLERDVDDKTFQSERTAYFGESGEAAPHFLYIFDPFIVLGKGLLFWDELVGKLKADNVPQIIQDLVVGNPYLLVMEIKSCFKHVANPAIALHQIEKRRRVSRRNKVNLLQKPEDFFHGCFRYILYELPADAFLKHWVRLRINLVHAIDSHPLNTDDVMEYIKKCDDSLKIYLNLDVFDELEEVTKVMGGDKDSLQSILKENSFLDLCLEHEFTHVFGYSQVSGLIDDLFKSSCYLLDADITKDEIFTFAKLITNKKLICNEYFKEVPFLVNPRYSPVFMFLLEKSSTFAVFCMVGYLNIEVYNDPSFDRYETGGAHEVLTIEYIFIVFIFAHILYEVGQLADENFRLKDYFKGYNIYDVISYSMLGTWGILTLTGKYYLFSRILLGLSAIPLSFQLLQFFTQFKSVGQVNIMLRKMAMEIVPIVFVLIVIFLGFGVSFYGIYKNKEPFESLEKTILTLFSSMLGNFDFTIFDGKHPEDINPVMLLIFSIYVVITTCVALNLIIAKLTTGYQKVEERSLEEWLYVKTQTVVSFMRLYETNVLCQLPPPWNIVTLCVYPVDIYTHNAFVPSISFAGIISDQILEFFAISMFYIFMYPYLRYKRNQGGVLLKSWDAFQAILFLPVYMICNFISVFVDYTPCKVEKQEQEKNSLLAKRKIKFRNTHFHGRDSFNQTKSGELNTNTINESDIKKKRPSVLRNLDIVEIGVAKQLSDWKSALASLFIGKSKPSPDKPNRSGKNRRNRGKTDLKNVPKTLLDHDRKRVLSCFTPKNDINDITRMLFSLREEVFTLQKNISKLNG